MIPPPDSLAPAKDRWDEGEMSGASAREPFARQEKRTGSPEKLRFETKQAKHVEPPGLTAIADGVKALNGTYDSMRGWMESQDKVCNRILGQQSRLEDAVRLLIDSMLNGATQAGSNGMRLEATLPEARPYEVGRRPVASIGRSGSLHVKDDLNHVEPDTCGMLEDRQISFEAQDESGSPKGGTHSTTTSHSTNLESWANHHTGHESENYLPRRRRASSGHSHGNVHSRLLRSLSRGATGDLGGIPDHHVPGHHDNRKTETYIKRQNWASRAAQAFSFEEDAPNFRHSALSFHHLREDIVQLHWVTFVEHIVHHPAFEVGSAIVILSHSLFIGIYVNYLASHSSDGHWVFSVGNIILTTIFCLEVLLKLIAERIHFIRGREMLWNLFDVTLLLLVLFELVIGSICGIDSCKGGLKTVLKTAEVIRTFRIMRIFRCLRVSLTLTTILSKIYGSIRSLCWIMVLFTMLNFVLSVTMTQGFNFYLDGRQHKGELGHADEELQERFGSIQNGMYTILLSFTGGTLWNEIKESVDLMGAFYSVLFVAFMVFASLFMLNIITGIFVDNAVKADKHLGQHKEDMRQAIRLEKVFDIMSDHAEGITYEQFMTFVKDATLQTYLHELNIEQVDACTLFHLLDEDGNGTIMIDELIAGLIRLKEPATCLDSKVMMFEMQGNWKWLRRALRGMEDHMIRDLRRQEHKLSSKVLRLWQTVQNDTRAQGQTFTRVVQQAAEAMRSSADLDEATSRLRGVVTRQQSPDRNSDPKALDPDSAFLCSRGRPSPQAVDEVPTPADSPSRSTNLHPPRPGLKKGVSWLNMESAVENAMEYSPTGSLPPSPRQQRELECSLQEVFDPASNVTPSDKNSPSPADITKKKRTLKAKPRSQRWGTKTSPKADAMVSATEDLPAERLQKAGTFASSTLFSET